MIGAADLIEKIKKAHETNVKANELCQPSQTSSPPEPAASTSGSASGSSSAQSSEQSSSDGPTTQTQQGPSVDPEEEKRQKAKKLQEKMDKIRLEKLEKEKEEEKRREIERRELGKNMQEFKEQQQLIKRKKELEERRREKEEEKAALKRVREQIARDRAEKAQRHKEAKLTEEERKKKIMEERISASAVEAQKDYAEKCKHAKLQYRLQDGSTVVRDYPSETTLAEAISDLKAQPMSLPTSSFRLAMGIPRRVFTAEDEQKTLAELGLPPRASLAVHPYEVVVSGLPANTQPAGPSVIGYLMAFVGIVLNIPIKLVTSLWSGLFGGRTQDSVDSSAANLSDKYPAPARPSTSSARNNDNEGPRARRGNMHRLHDTKRDDDDDVNTWNGNSTQQM